MISVTEIIFNNKKVDCIKNWQLNTKENKDNLAKLEVVCELGSNLMDIFDEINNMSDANFILDNKIIFTIVRMNTMSIVPASDNVNQVLSCYGKWKMI